MIPLENLKTLNFLVANLSLAFVTIGILILSFFLGWAISGKYKNDYKSIELIPE